jgi:hypothetical protein
MPPTRRELSLSHRRRNPPRNQRRSYRQDEQCSAIRSSPLQHLPTELLYEIVKIYFDLDPNGSITTITQIFRRLRQVVLGMAAVWKRISLLPTYSMKGPEYKRFGVGYLYWVLPTYSIFKRIGFYAPHKNNLRLCLNIRGLALLTFISSGQLQKERLKS